jgi:hypothetical protein
VRRERRMECHKRVTEGGEVWQGESKITIFTIYTGGGIVRTGNEGKRERLDFHIII